MSGDRLPFELVRGEFTFGMQEEIGDDDLLIMFQVGPLPEGRSPRVWVSSRQRPQEAPAVGDVIAGAEIGLEPGIWRVKLRCWHKCNLMMCMMAPAVSEGDG